MFAIKTEVPDITLNEYEFLNQKTMYGGKTIAAGDIIFCSPAKTKVAMVCSPVRW